MDSIIAAGSSSDSQILWVFFTLFIGIALAIDFGIIGKFLHVFRIRNRNRNNDNNTHNDSCQKIEISSVLPVRPMLSQEEGRQQQQQIFKRALVWTIIWISLAGIFAAIIYLTMGYEKTLLFVTGYAIEKSLSIDNMFVFLLIFSSLAIPHVYQHKVLMVGIPSAIVMRIALILAGVSLLESFQWMIYIFGGLLLFTAIRMILQNKEEQGKKKEKAIEKNIAVRILKKFVPITFELNNDKFLLHKNNGHKVLYATPLLVALVIVETTDLVFALDSIPAILAITTDSFVVITSNIFALLGLRSLYFLLVGMVEKFYYLKLGLAMILFFIGGKMIVSEFFEIPIVISLMVIFGILGVALLLSFIRTHNKKQRMIIDK